MSLHKQNVRVSDMFTASKVKNSVVPRYWHSIPRLSLCVCVYSPCSNTLPRLAALWAVNISKRRLRYCIVTPSFATSVNAYHLFRRAYRLLRSTFFFLAVRLGSAALKVLSVYNTCADTRVFEQFNNVRKTSIKTKTTRRTPSEPQNTAIF